MPTTTPTLPIIPIIGGATLGLLAACQPQYPQPPTAAPQTESANDGEDLDGTSAEPTARGPDGDVSEQEVESFARAYLAIATLERAYAAKLESAANQQESASLQIEAREQMERVIEDEGMTIDEFQAIGQAVDSDEELRNRVESTLEDLQGEPPAAETSPPGTAPPGTTPPGGISPPAETTPPPPPPPPAPGTTAQ